MKQVSQNYRSGVIKLEDVCAPALRSGGVLVRTHYSVISAGTEGMKVREARLSYLGKARARPDQVKKVIQTFRQQGFVATYNKVMNKLDSLTPLGYSLSGEVVAVGSGAEEFRVGQRVACGGASYANHAELNYIPKNLVVPLPDQISMKHGAFATVGAIALQGLRQSEMQLGEAAGVIGLGLLGQLLVQILVAAGIRVIGVDPVRERCDLARGLGAAHAFPPSDTSLMAAVKQITASKGLDCLFITAGGNTNEPVELAVALARDRARIVDIGKTRLDLPWNDYYLKELDLRFSRSYGPGRYDAMYEEQGIDYPIGYVRWTERRNMSAFLDLVSANKVLLDPLIGAVRPFAEAEQTYQEMAEGRSHDLVTIFEYPTARNAASTTDPLSIFPREARVPAKDGRVQVGVIGAGSYASSMLLPYLRDDNRVNLRAVATTSGLTSLNAKRKFGFELVTTDYRKLLNDDQIDAVLIATRHSSHASLVLEALRSGKAVYVEKPLALTVEEIESIRCAIVESRNDRLMVGFNRRFSKILVEVERRFNAGSALTVHYRVHAGQLDPGTWYTQGSEGSRFIGEAGHFFDVFAFLTGARPVSVMASSLRPTNVTPDDLVNIVTSVEYDDGSIANLLYLTQGPTRIPKEYIEVFGQGRAARIENFESAVMFEGDASTKIKSRGVDKGQEQQLRAFIDSVSSGAPMPISLDSLFDTTLVTLAVPRALTTGERIFVSAFCVPSQ